MRIAAIVLALVFVLPVSASAWESPVDRMERAYGITPGVSSTPDLMPMPGDPPSRPSALDEARDLKFGTPSLDLMQREQVKGAVGLPQAWPPPIPR